MTMRESGTPSARSRDLDLGRREAAKPAGNQELHVVAAARQSVIALRQGREVGRLAA